MAQTFWNDKFDYPSASKTGLRFLIYDGEKENSDTSQKVKQLSFICNIQIKHWQGRMT